MFNAPTIELDVILGVGNYPKFKINHTTVHKYLNTNKNIIG